MLQRWAGLGFLFLWCGCSTMKDVSPYGEPFKIDREYVATGPVSAYVGDTPYEPASGVSVPDQHSLRDAAILVPGTRVRFVRKDSPYLVFLILTGDERARYAWVSQHSEDIPSLQRADSVKNPG
jgi:hypothetical protein